MAINSPKWRLPLFAIILTVFILIPGIASAAPFGFNYPAAKAIIDPAGHIVTDYPNLSELDLTPMQRQQLQGILQRRNKEMAAVLTSSQRTELQHQLHSGHSLLEGLLKLDLQPEQEHLIKAIEQFTNLKIKAALTRYSLLN